MNYIQRLKQENEDLLRQIAELEERVQRVEEYLHSDKFRCGSELDRYVEVGDVLIRLRS